MSRGAAASAGGPRAFYEGRRETLVARIAALEESARRLTTQRLVISLAALASWVGADLVSGGRPLRIVTVLLVMGFVAMVRRHRRIRRELKRSEAALAWARIGVARMDRDWDGLPALESPAPADHPWAADLDLFGHASLTSLLGPVHTSSGRASRDGWLLNSSEPDATQLRQEAVRELATRADLLEAVGTESALSVARGVGAGAEFRAFQEWCTGDPRPVPLGLAVAGWVLPIAFIVCLTGHLAGFMEPRWWVILAAVQAVIAFRWGSGRHGDFAAVSGGLRGLDAVPPLLAIWEAAELAAPALRAEQGRLATDGEAASSGIQRLRRLVHLADMRLSDLYPVFSIGLLWDVHVAVALERWRGRHGRNVPAWFEALGVLEGLSSLAVLAHDNPGWCWPEPSAEDDGGSSGSSATGSRFTATALGHPLLPVDACVTNDVEVGPRGTLLLVTGSNMSGKSTLLRAIGLAVVLGEAGAPVCAGSLRLPAVRLRTSMRIQDSIESGVSFFMAELLRLRDILEAAREPGRPVLYLVDEILQGTNSEERQTASRRFIRHLLKGPALGAVTTHDLDLHRDPRVESVARMVHFREVVAEDGGSLSFDYRLRPGLATTRNALLLAERVGITDPDAEPPRGRDEGRVNRTLDPPPATG